MNELGMMRSISSPRHAHLMMMSLTHSAARPGRAIEAVTLVIMLLLTGGWQRRIYCLLLGQCCGVLLAWGTRTPRSSHDVTLVPSSWQFGPDSIPRTPPPAAMMSDTSIGCVGDSQISAFVVQLCCVDRVGRLGGWMPAFGFDRSDLELIGGLVARLPSHQQKKKDDHLRISS